MEIKVAFTHVWYPAGGSTKITSDLAEYLSSKGYRIYVFVEKLDEKSLSEADRRNITFVPARLRGLKSFTEGVRSIVGDINRLGIDILVTPGGIRNYMMARIKRLTRCKIVFALHSLPLWQIAGYFESRHHKALHSGSVGRFLEWFLAVYPFEALTGRHKRSRIGKYRRNYLNCDLYTVLCEDYRRQMLEILGPAVATERNNHVEVIPNYIPPHDYGEPVKEKTVLFMGRLSYGDKRVDRLLDVWAMVHRDFPDWELCIVGDGEERERLVRRAGELRLERVEFRGHTSDPGEYYSRASILCLTSTFEGWPLVIAEGQQAGAIPIAFDSAAGIRRQLAPDGVNGILVTPFDKREYARRLAELMSDEALRDRMRRSVLLRSKEYSDADRLAKWDRSFKNLLKQP